MNADQKIEFLENSRAHFAADMLLKGTYSDVDAASFRGCSVGCHVHHIFPRKSKIQIANLDGKHGLVATHYGYPAWLAHLQDTIFEGLPNGESAKWHVLLAETLATLPDDYDWQLALHRVHIAILRVSYRTAGSAQEAAQRVIDLHECAVGGNSPSEDDWSAARSAAEAAAEAAARSAAWSAARSAAWSAAEAAAWSAAWSAAYQEMRDAVLAALMVQS